MHANVATQELLALEASSGMHILTGPTTVACKSSSDRYSDEAGAADEDETDPDVIVTAAAAAAAAALILFLFFPPATKLLAPVPVARPTATFLTGTRIATHATTVVCYYYPAHRRWNAE